ncbi:MAG: hypothetical protein J7K98_01855 [Candidatus Aenigmarchaeota archaeon]|nr:hypothetical protein [Candidatus Aenigmarchaeota archaeon]
MGIFDRIGRILKKKEDVNKTEKLEPLPLNLPSLESHKVNDLSDTPMENMVEDVKPFETFEAPLPPTKPVPVTSPNVTEEKPDDLSHETVKTKLDLILTKIDNLKAQNEAIIERLKKIEKSLEERRGIRYY